MQEKAHSCCRWRGNISHTGHCDSPTPKNLDYNARNGTERNKMRRDKLLKSYIGSTKHHPLTHPSPVQKDQETPRKTPELRQSRHPIGHHPPNTISKPPTLPPSKNLQPLKLNLQPPPLTLHLPPTIPPMHPSPLTDAKIRRPARIHADTHALVVDAPEKPRHFPQFLPPASRSPSSSSSGYPTRSSPCPTTTTAAAAKPPIAQASVPVVVHAIVSRRRIGVEPDPERVADALELYAEGGVVWLVGVAGQSGAGVRGGVC